MPTLNRIPAGGLAASVYEPPSAAATDASGGEFSARQNQNFSPDDDDKLFRATGFRYSLAQQRGFPYPWCAKKHGRKGWIVRDSPPDLNVGAAVGYSAPPTSHATTKNNNGVEFEGWNEAKRVLRSRQMLLQRFGLQEQSLLVDGSKCTSTENNENMAVAGGGAVAQSRAMIENWYQKTPAVMKQQRKVHQETLQLAAEKKRKREELDLNRKRQKELREMKEREKMQKKNEKMQKKNEKKKKKKNVLDKRVQYAEEVGANSNNEGTVEKNDAPESPPRHKFGEQQQAAVSSPSRSKRKGTQPRRDNNKYRDIELSFIENQSLLLRSPVRQTYDSASLSSSPSTPIRMMNTPRDTSHPLILQSSPTRMKYKRTQPRKNTQQQQQQQQRNSPHHQSSSIILGEDPLMDQMIEDIVKEFTTTTEGDQMVAHGHLFDIGAVSALREAAMDMVVYNLEEKTRVASASAAAAIGGNCSSAANTTNNSPQLDHDDKRMERMIERLIGEVAQDSGCNFDGPAVEALKMAAREIVTTDNDIITTPSKTEYQSVTVEAGVSKNGGGKSEESAKAAATSSPSNPSYDIQPLHLDSEDSNMSEVGGMIAQLVDDLGKEADIQFDASAVKALKKASRLI